MTRSTSPGPWDDGFFARAIEHAELVINEWLDHHGRGADYLIYVQTWGGWALTEAAKHLCSGLWSSPLARASDELEATAAPELDESSCHFVRHATAQAWLALTHAVADLIEHASGGHPEAIKRAGQLRALYTNTYDDLRLANE